MVYAGPMTSSRRRMTSSWWACCLPPSTPTASAQTTWCVSSNEPNPVLQVDVRSFHAAPTTVGTRTVPAAVVHPQCVQRHVAMVRVCDLPNALHQLRRCRHAHHIQHLREKPPQRRVSGVEAVETSPCFLGLTHSRDVFGVSGCEQAVGVAVCPVPLRCLWDAGGARRRHDSGRCSGQRCCVYPSP